MLSHVVACCRMFSHVFACFRMFSHVACFRMSSHVFACFRMSPRICRIVGTHWPHCLGSVRVFVHICLCCVPSMGACGDVDAVPLLNKRPVNMFATRSPLGLHDPSFCLYLACSPFLLCHSVFLWPLRPSPLPERPSSGSSGSTACPATSSTWPCTSPRTVLEFQRKGLNFDVTCN